jgi:hypothetical protein
VRHHLVQRIIRAYDEYKTRQPDRQLPLSLEVKPVEVKPQEAKPAAPEAKLPDNGKQVRVENAPAPLTPQWTDETRVRD